MGVDAVIQFETKKDFTDNDIKKLSYRIGDAFGYRGYSDAKGVYFTYLENGRIEFDTLWRYYGIGYERGPLIKILSVIRFIRDYIGNNLLAIYYAGDNVECPVETTPEKEKLLWEHFVKVGHLPYLGTHENHKCPICNNSMWRSGWNGGKHMYSCPGCGYSDWKDKK